MYLLFSPELAVCVSGFLLILLGLLGYALALPGVTIHGAKFDAHTLLFASLAMLMGYQSVIFSIFCHDSGRERRFAAGKCALASTAFISISSSSAVSWLARWGLPSE